MCSPNRTEWNVENDWKSVDLGKSAIHFPVPGVHDCEIISQDKCRIGPGGQDLTSHWECSSGKLLIHTCKYM